jgi:hypothetical protein
MTNSKATNKASESDYNIIGSISLCTASSARKWYVAYFRYAAKGDRLAFDKATSTFISQELRCLATKAVSWGINLLDLSTETFEILKYVPGMFGTGLMYCYRYWEESTRNENILKFSMMQLVFLTGSAIGLLGTYVKDTPFSKMPNLIYAHGLGRYKDLKYNKKYLELPDDIIENLIVSYIDNNTKEQFRGVEEFIKSSFATNNINAQSINVTEVDNIKTSRVKFFFSDFTEKCNNDHFFSNNNFMYKDMYHNELDNERYFTIEQKFILPKGSKKSCLFPCLDPDICNSQIKFYNSQRKEVFLVEAADLPYVCSSEFIEEISSKLQGSILECENTL